MSYRVVQPPSNDEEFAAVGQKLVKAGIALGLRLDAEGFLFSWVNGTRVVIEELDGEIVSMALLATGKRWTHNDTTATVLNMETKREPEPMLEFLKQIASALGCTILFVEDRATEQQDGRVKYTVYGYQLG